MTRSLLLTAFLSSVVLTPSLARADDRADFAELVKKQTGEYASQYIIENLVTFKVGEACWTKLKDTDQWALKKATFFVRAVEALAKRGTGESWSDIETANNSDREGNKGTVEKAVKAFAPTFGVTFVHDGKDCDTTSSGALMRYWGAITDSLQHLSGKKPVKIVLNVKPSKKAKDVTVAVKKGTITITAPSDKETPGWDSKILEGIKKAKL